jgi:hypothetical protein
MERIPPHGAERNYTVRLDPVPATTLLSTTVVDDTGRLYIAGVSYTRSTWCARYGYRGREFTAECGEPLDEATASAMFPEFAALELPYYTGEASV